MLNKIKAAVNEKRVDAFMDKFTTEELEIIAQAHDTARSMPEAAKTAIRLGVLLIGKANPDISQADAVVKFSATVYNRGIQHGFPEAIAEGTAAKAAAVGLSDAINMSTGNPLL